MDKVRVPEFDPLICMFIDEIIVLKRHWRTISKVKLSGYMTGRVIFKTTPEVFRIINCIAYMEEARKENTAPKGLEMFVLLISRIDVVVEKFLKT